MKFYLAARFDTREKLLKDVVVPLEAAGHQITSRWLHADPDINVLNTELLKTDAGLARAMHVAYVDLEDVDAADIVVVFTDSPSSTGGYHVEFGYALASGKYVIVVGPRQNVFQTYPSVVHFNTVEEFLNEKYLP